MWRVFREELGSKGAGSSNRDLTLGKRDPSNNKDLDAAYPEALEGSATSTFYTSRSFRLLTQ